MARVRKGNLSQRLAPSDGHLLSLPHLHCSRHLVRAEGTQIAIKPTFNIPATWKVGGRSPNLPTSMLFYAGILGVSAAKWGETFEQLTDRKGSDLKKYYIKCYIAEAYLIAEKVADKLRILSPGIGALRWAMVLLMIFFVMFGATLATLSPTRPSTLAIQSSTTECK